MRLSARRLIFSLIIVLFCGLDLFSSRAVGQTAANAEAAKPQPAVPCWTGADFWIDGQPADVKWPTNLADPAKRQELVIWGSWCGMNDRTGGLELGPFVAPDHFSMLISGTPFDQGNVLKLVRISDSATIIPTHETMNNVWKQVDVVLPADWIGKRIKIVAWDLSDKSWLAFSEPFVLRRTGEARALWKNRTKSLRGLYWWNQTLGPITAAFAIYTIIGIAGYSLLRRWIDPTPYLAPILIRAITGLAGYVTFWAFFCGPQIGRSVAWGILALSIAYLLYRAVIARKFLLTGPEWFEFKWTFILTIVAVLFDLGVVGLPRVDGTPFDVLTSRRETLIRLPDDNVLQQNISRLLFDGKNPVLASSVEWQTSDRPPLEAGTQLLCGPMVPGLFHVSWDANAQMSGVVFQLSWIFAVWALLRSMGCSPRAACAIVLCLLPTPLLYLNTVFVWAKLSAAAYVLAMTVLLCFRGNRLLSLFEAVIAGSMLSLGLLCHSGIFFFALPVLVLWFIFPHASFLLRWKPALVLVISSLLLFAPWMCYQKFVDPPGNRLLKLSFAGASTPNSIPLGQALRAAYGALTPRQIVDYKLSNFHRLIEGDWPTFFSLMPPDRWERRTSAFAFLFRSLGIYLIGILAFPILYRTQNRTKRRQFYFLLSTVAIAIVVWCVLMFGPATTIVHAGAYGVPLVLLILLLYLIVLVHPVLLLVIGLYNLMQFLWIYGWSFPYPPRTDSVAVGLLIASFAISFLLLVFAPSHDDKSAQIQPG